MIELYRHGVYFAQRDGIFGVRRAAPYLVSRLGKLLLVFFDIQVLCGEPSFRVTSGFSVLDICLSFLSQVHDAFGQNGVFMMNVREQRKSEIATNNFTPGHGARGTVTVTVSWVSLAYRSQTPLLRYTVCSQWAVSLTRGKSEYEDLNVCPSTWEIQQESISQSSEFGNNQLRRTKNELVGNNCVSLGCGPPL